MIRRHGPFAFITSAAVSLGAAAALASCAPGFSPPPRPAPSTLAAGSPLASHSLSDGAAWLRQYLMVGEYEAALDLLARSSDVGGDALLRRMQAGVVLHQAGRFAESNRAFEWAEREADRRITRSVSRAAGSLLVNDRVLAYTPSRAELAAIPYYRMLNYLGLGDLEGAQVEARKASALLERIAGERGETCIGNGFLQYLAGLVFDAAGDENAALVSFRQAEASFDDCGDASNIAPPPELGHDLIRSARALGFADIADAAIERYGEPASADASTGEVVILIEHGFVAHRAEEEIYVPIFAEDTDGLSGDDEDGIATVAGRIGAQLVERRHHAGTDYHGRWPGESGLVYWSGYGADVAHVLKLAWPVARLEASRAAAVRVVVDSSTHRAEPLYDLSLLQVRALESERVHLATRMIARGLLKYLVTREVEEEVEERNGETAAMVVGLLINTAANLVEQADTRSWSLLPDQVSFARIRLPPGDHTVRLRVLDAAGAPVRTLDLGSIHVESGQRKFVSRRVWGAYDGGEERFARSFGESGPRTRE